MRIRFTNLLPVLWLLGCQDADLPASDPGLNNPPVHASLTLNRLTNDSNAFARYSGVRDPQQLVIRDAVAWSVLWATIHATTDPIPPLPDIDFTREMIVAAALGTRSTGGYDVRLTEAALDSAGIAIQVLETSPGPSCYTTQALTQPIDLGRIERRDDPVHFVVTQHVVRCDP